MMLALSASAIAQQPPIKIGFGMSLTGGLAANGKAALIAMQIWAEDVNARGGILGRKVELVFYDDQSTPSAVPGIYNKLLDVDKVDLVVSGYGTNVTAPVMPIVMQRKLTFMALFGLDVNGKFKHDRYFQMMPAGPQPTVGWTSGFFEVANAMNPKPETIAFVGANAEYGHAALDGGRYHAKRLGLKIVYDKTYPPNTVDFGPVFRALQATKPDLVYVASYPSETAGVVRAAHEVGLKTRMFGGAMVGTQFAAIRKQLGPLLNGVMGYEFFALEVNDKFPTIEKFIAKYQPRAVKEGVDPLGYYLPPYAYAELEVLEQAIKAVGSLDQGKLADYIHKNSFDTVVGKVSFAANGEWSQPRVLAVQYQNITGNDLEEWTKPGKVAVLYPAGYKTGNLQPYFQGGKK